MAALLRGRQLILEVHARGARLDHLLHQLEGVQHAAEAGFGVRDDRLEPVDGVVAFGVVQLVRALQRAVDAPDHGRHRVRRIQRLVRIHLAGEIRIARDLPAGEIDGVEPGLHLLHGLVAGERAERVDERLLVHVAPELLGAEPREAVLDVHRAAKAHDVLGACRRAARLSSAGSFASLWSRSCAVRFIVVSRSSELNYCSRR